MEKSIAIPLMKKLLLLCVLLLTACASPVGLVENFPKEPSCNDNVSSAMAPVNAPPVGPPLGYESGVLLAGAGKSIAPLKESYFRMGFPSTNTNVTSTPIKRNTKSSRELTDNKSTIKSIPASLGVNMKKDMPRWRYLMWAGVLFLAGLIFVAFSSAEILGILSTLAFTGALVFLILWIIKK